MILIGAAASEKRLLVLKPSTNANPDAAKIILYLLKQGMSGITFCNSRQAVKSLLGLVKSEAIRQRCPGYEDKVAIFYGSLTGDRRAEIIEQLQSGQIRFIISTEALEAGIDLPELDCCLIRGWPGSIMSFRQRIGRAGRARPGLAIFLPVAQSPLDQYFSSYPTLLLSGEAEQVNFNESYPILLAKHLLCACVETGIPTNKLKRYFGSAAPKVVMALMRQDQIFKGRKGLWAKGFPHKDVNFRGGSSSGTIKLVDADLSGEEFEEMSEDIAFREVYPGAIYRCQNADGQMLNFCSVSLDLDSRKAILKRVADNPTFTVAITESKTNVEDRLAAPIQIPLSFSNPRLSQDKDCAQSQLQLELAWGKISQMVIGYQLLTKQYELTCLNQRCLKYKEPQPSRRNCPSCGKKTREAEIISVFGETKFEKPYQTQFTTPVVQVSLNNQAQKHLQDIAAEIRKAITQKAQAIPAGYQQLWEYPSSLIALHSFGHQVMAALPLVVLSSHNDINYVVERTGDGGYYGLFYDCSEGGNGASEAVFQNLTKLASTAAQLAQSCECETGCPKCLQQHGCPQGNKGLLKQLGITLLRAIPQNSLTL